MELSRCLPVFRNPGMCREKFKQNKGRDGVEITCSLKIIISWDTQ